MRTLIIFHSYPMPSQRRLSDEFGKENDQYRVLSFRYLDFALRILDRSAIILFINSQAIYQYGMICLVVGTPSTSNSCHTVTIYEFKIYLYTRNFLK